MKFINYPNLRSHLMAGKQLEEVEQLTSAIKVLLEHIEKQDKRIQALEQQVGQLG